MTNKENKESGMNWILSLIAMVLTFALINYIFFDLQTARKAICTENGMTVYESGCIDSNGKIFDIKKQRKVILVPREESNGS